MTNNVAIIGCGKHGIRHIQGLGVSNLKINVHIYDSNLNSISKCKNTIKNIKQDILNLSINFYDCLDLLSSKISKFDLIIIATTARNRPELMKKLLKYFESMHWILEKPICQSPDELDSLIDILKNINIWVNYPRRFSSMYQKLKYEFFKCQKIDITFSGFNLGIGCNISHLIDIVNFFTEEIPISIDTTGLSNKWHDAKRISFMDVEGSLKCFFSGGTKMNVISKIEKTQNENQKKLLIEGKFIDSGKKFKIKEEEGLLLINRKKYQFERALLQSEITGKIYDQIKFDESFCLTPFPLAAECYRLAIKSLLEHWQLSSGNPKDNIVPLT